MHASAHDELDARSFLQWNPTQGFVSDSSSTSSGGTRDLDSHPGLSHRPYTTSFKSSGVESPSFGSFGGHDSYTGGYQSNFYGQSSYAPLYGQPSYASSYGHSSYAPSYGHSSYAPSYGQPSYAPSYGHAPSYAPSYGSYNDFYYYNTYQVCL